jgi:hypothetical protein
MFQDFSVNPLDNNDICVTLEINFPLKRIFFFINKKQIPCCTTNIPAQLYPGVCYFSVSSILYI